MKKLLSVVLALVLLTAFAVPAFADRQDEPQYDVWLSEGNFDFKLTRTEDGPALKTVWYSKQLMGEDAYIPKTLGGVALTPEVLSASHILNYQTPFRVDDDNAYFSVIDGALCSKDGQTLIRVPFYRIFGRYASDTENHGGIYRVPDGIRTIGADSISATDATCVVIPDSVTRIEPGSGVENAGAIAANRGTAAEVFARENGVLFVSLGEGHAHVWFRVRNDATCMSDGEAFAACPCGERTDAVAIPSRPGAHWYEYTDDTYEHFRCIYCGAEKTGAGNEDCACACHTISKSAVPEGNQDLITFLRNVIYRFRLIVWRLTGTHKYCECGARHY